MLQLACPSKVPTVENLIDHHEVTPFKNIDIGVIKKR